MSAWKTNAFAGSGLDRAGERRPNAERLAQDFASDRARVLVFDGTRVLADAAGPVWLTGAAAQEAHESPLFLGIDADGRSVFAARLKAGAGAAQGAPEDLRPLAARCAPDDLAMLGCAKSLYEWHGRHGFCANCGSPTQIAEGGWRRDCPACGAHHFPRVDPVVIMLPVFEGRCCLGRQAKWPPRMHSAFAGYVEPGESLEEACARELKEEAGLLVRSAVYHSSQPWPFPSSLMVGMHATVESEALAVDGVEIESAVWLTREEARAALEGRAILATGEEVMTPPATAIAHQLVKDWASGEV